MMQEGIGCSVARHSRREALRLVTTGCYHNTNSNSASDQSIPMSDLKCYHGDHFLMECSVGTVSASRTVGREFTSRPGHTKDHHKNGTNCLPA